MEPNKKVNINITIMDKTDVGNPTTYSQTVPWGREMQTWRIGPWKTESSDEGFRKLKNIFEDVELARSRRWESNGLGLYRILEGGSLQRNGLHFVLDETGRSVRVVIKIWENEVELIKAENLTPDQLEELKSIR